MLGRKQKKGRLQQLEELLKILAKEIDGQPGPRELPSLAKQYRETLAEIEAIRREEAPEEVDEVTELLNGRAVDGKPGAVRQNRSAV